jgi:thiol-disulfide isomerase/thioredoxin
MGGKLAVSAGLVTGIAAGAALVAGVALLAPDTLLPPVPTRPAPTPVVVDASILPEPSAAPVEVVATPTAATASGAPASDAPASSSPAASEGGELFGIGRPAPPLLVSQLGGGEIDLAALAGKPLWVTFMATWCPSCRDELPRMTQLQARYADTGLVVVVVDVGEDEGAVDAYMRSLGVTFPVGLDTDGEAHEGWGAYALPVHYWIDAEGIIRHGALGGIGPDIMAEGLTTILPGVTVTT